MDDGHYALQIDAAGVSDTVGNAGSGSREALWQLDQTAPTSRVEIQSTTATSLSVPLLLHGEDPAATNGATGSGVASFDIYVSRDDAPFEFWKTVKASSIAATTLTRYTAESNHRYAFHSIAKDKAGKVESKPGDAVEAFVDVPDLSPPATQVVSIDQTTSVWLVTIAGTDVGISGIASFDLWVSTDGGPARKVGSAIAGPAAADGSVQATIPFRAISDGTPHTYRLYSVGRDLGGKIEKAPTAPADLVVSATHAPLSIVSFDVQRGEAQRSLVQFVEVTLDRTDELPLIVTQINDAVRGNESVRLTRYLLDGTAPVAVPLAGKGTLASSTLTLDFGPQGLRTDGYYVLELDLDGDGAFETLRRFYRLQGDFDGDRIVTGEDDVLLQAHLGETGTGNPLDLTGDSAVNTRDRTALARLLGRKLADGLPIDPEIAELTATLADDTGGSDTDRLTNDPTIVGTVTGGNGAMALEAAFALGVGAPVFHDVTARLTAGAFELRPVDLEEVLGDSLADGDHTVLVRVRAGDTLSLPVAVSFTLDRTIAAPALALWHDTGLSGADQLTSDPSVTGSSNDPHGTMKLEAAFETGELLEFVDVTGLLQNGTFLLTASDLAALLGTPLGDDNYTLLLRSTDFAGNRSTQSQLELTLDTAGPKLVIASPADNAFANQNVTVTGSGAPGSGTLARFEWRLDGGPFLDLPPGAGGGFNFSTSFLLNGSQDGLHTIEVRGTDLAGNTGPSSHVRLTLDTIAPTPPEFDLSIGSDSGSVGDQTTDYARVTLTGNAEPGATITLLETGATTLVSNQGTFFLPAVQLPEGSSTLTIAVSDRAGNTSQTARTFNRLRDSEAADPVLAWNQVALEAIRLDASTPPAASRMLAILHSAILDAVNAIEGTPGRYIAITPAPGSSPTAAVAAAAHFVLSYHFPAQQSYFDDELATSFADVPDGPAQDGGVDLGQKIAKALIDIRRHDGYDAFVEYYGNTTPGQWQATAPMYAIPLLPHWGEVQPFIISSVDAFPLPGPPELGSEEWAVAYNEVKSIGSATSDTRTDEQTEIARFWADGAGTYTPAGHWNQIAALVGQSQGNSLADNARAFAALNTALADAAIAAWHVKYTDGFWRPITAIQNGESDGNDATSPDPLWRPLLVTPPFPEYVSGHSTYGGAAATVLSSLFGDNVAFTVGSLTPQEYVRSFTSFDQAAEEASRSRIYGGIHYSFSGEDGLTLGVSIGQAVLDAFSYSVDTQAPSIVVDAIPAVTNHNIEITGRILDNLAGLQTAEVAVDGGDFVALALDALGRFTVTTALPTDGSAEGMHVVQVRAVDAAGNPSSRSLSFVLDTTAPVLTISSPGDTQVLNANSRLTGTANGTGSPLVALWYAFDGGAPMHMSVSDSFDVPPDLSRLSLGTHALTLTALDASGNSATQSLTVELATTLPLEIADVSPTNGAADVGTTFRPKVTFSRPIDASTLRSSNFYATETTGAHLPANIVPAADGSFAWLFFADPLPGASTITVTVDGATIATADGTLLDAAGTGTPGSRLTFHFSTVSLAPLVSTQFVRSCRVTNISWTSSSRTSDS